jgi:twitching motility protein PilT
MDLRSWVERAKDQGASDLHLEAGHSPAFRVRGVLRSSGDRLVGDELTSLARAVLGEDGWSAFLEQGSADLSRTVAGVRCRVNVLRSARGVGLAIRMLHAPAATLRSLNLHPDLLRLVRPTHGLVLVAGPTGAGKSTTAAALVQEINLAESRHVITLESPIEYTFAPRRCVVRQREVGRDTPSFAQGLVDAMREDPDVLLVGEMREPEVMRLTLNAAETGHLVLATVHSSTVAEALQRIVASFPAEVQAGMCAQLGDCLVGAVAQRLAWRADQDLLVPECEVLMANSGARAVVRQGHFFKLATVIESGGADGCWSFGRYRAWLDQKQDWVRPTAGPDPDEEAPPAPWPTRRTAPAARPREDGVLDLDGEAADLGAAIEALEQHRR